MGWLASIMLLLGGWAIARRNVVGWPLSLVGNALWAIIGVRAGMADLTCVEFIFCGMNCYGWYEGRRCDPSQP